MRLFTGLDLPEGVVGNLEELLRRHGVREVVRRRKPDASRPVPPEMLDDFVTADAIVSGIGD